MADTQHMFTIESGKRNTHETVDYNSTGYVFAFAILPKNFKELQLYSHGSDQSKYLKFRV